MIFLRIWKRNRPDEVKRTLIQLWKMYENLKLGKVSDLLDYAVPKGQYMLSLTMVQMYLVWIGYPRKFQWTSRIDNFYQLEKGAPIATGSGIKYSNEECDNLGLSEDIAIQLISTTQLATYRAIVETKNSWSKMQAKY